MRKFTKLLLLLGCIICIQSCNDDDFTPNPTQDGATNVDQQQLDEQFRTENFGNATTGKFIGTITNSAGNKLENVQITIGNAVTFTNTNGIFILNDVDVFENFAYIKAQKEGYIKGSRAVIPKTDGANVINIVLLEKEVTATINSGESSQVAMPNGAEVNFTGDFITANGDPYNGAVEVVLHYIAPNSEETFSQMPGSLLAQTATNDASVLETYGMLSVNLFSPSGEELNIDTNAPATIEFPVDISQTSIAPETIPLWYFDEAQGYWKEEGSATKEGNTYVAEVTHFTWWNCDVPFDSINFCFSINPQDPAALVESTIPYYVVITRVSNGQMIYAGNVLSQEVECGLIPINEEILISIYGLDGSCTEQLVHSETLGGYATDTTVEISFTEDITITPITGIATNCDGASITNGYIYINDTNTFSITDGTIDIAYVSCASEVITIKILDFDTGLWSIIENVNVNGTAVDLGTVSTCDAGGGMYEGDVVLSTQDEINFFGLFGYTTINGDLTIGGNDGGLYESIVDLSPLASIENIQGSLNILNTTQLISLEGLNSLTQILTLRFHNNTQLVSLSGLNNLTTCPYLLAIGNESFASLAALENLTEMASIFLFHNPSLASFAGFQNLTSLDRLSVGNSDSITDFTGFEQITEISILWIGYNDSLVSLNGLQNITTINYSEYSPAISIGGPTPESNNPGDTSPNSNLTDLCALQNLLVNGNGINFEIIIENNAYNPTIQNIIDGNCSQ
jgi:hypothetical protein